MTTSESVQTTKASRIWNPVRDSHAQEPLQKEIKSHADRKLHS